MAVGLAFGVVTDVWVGSTLFCCQSSDTKQKSPVNRHLQSVGGGVEVVGGRRGRRFGRLGVSWTWTVVWSVCVARVHEN